MSLYEVLQQRGYAFRQHLEEEGWGKRKLTVVDLDRAQREALAQGGVAGLGEALDRQGTWSFPAIDIEAPLPVRQDLVLTWGGRPAATVIAPEGDRGLARMAQDLVGAVEKRFGVALPLVGEGEAGLALLQSQDGVVFGGSHENRFAMEMALGYQECFVDGSVPGEGGWVVTTHAGLDASGHLVVQVSAPPGSREAMACLLEALAEDGDRVVLRHTHRICQGRSMREHFPSWEAFTTGLPGSIPQLRGREVEATQDPAALADLLREGLNSGGPEVNLTNSQPIDIAVRSARYYQRSADPRGLQLFRELLFRLADYYLVTPEGASYPSDLDFRLGNLILCFSRLEHEPVFTEEDRLILANLLLSCTRSIYEYNLKQWPVEPDEPTRHNHETFAARSLLFAADYFERYGIPDAADWRARADLVFSGGLWHRFKQRENAGHYELYAFEHGATYSLFTGRGLDLFDPDCLRQAALRPVVTTDNFFRPVDYGDTRVQMRNEGSDTLAAIVCGLRDEPTLQWYTREAFARFPHYQPSPTHGITGIRRNDSGDPPRAGAWEVFPLDSRFVALFCPGFPQEHAFDKLAFRTGWGDEDHYLLFEGVGNRTISHSHNEVNGIVRLNHLGRHWVVSNGYGRRVRLANVSQSFSTRIRGPEDHNMLVLRRKGEIVRDLPVCNALLQRGQAGDLAFCTGALLDYGGVNWFRTLLLLSGRFVLVIDRVQVVGSGLEAGHIEWNCLGKATAREDGFRLDQQGVFMDVASDSGWAAQEGVADESADWKSVLESGAYPYASFPLTKLVFQMTDVEAGQRSCLVTLLAATRSHEAACRVHEPEPGLVVVTPADGRIPDLSVEDGDLLVRTGGGSLEIRFAPEPGMPEALRGDC